MSIKLTDNNYDQYTQQDKLTVVDFWAEWCGPCRAMAPVIEQLSAQFEGKANIGKLDVDKNANAAAQYGVTAIPTIIFFREGREIKRFVGVKSKTEIEKEITARL